MGNYEYLSESYAEEVNLMVTEKVVHHALIKLDGEAYDALKVRGILRELRSGAYTVDLESEMRMVEALVSRGVLTIIHAGRSFTTVGTGPNAPKFLENLERLIDTCGYELVSVV